MRSMTIGAGTGTPLNVGPPSGLPQHPVLPQPVKVLEFVSSGVLSRSDHGRRRLCGHPFCGRAESGSNHDLDAEGRGSRGTDRSIER